MDESELSISSDSMFPFTKFLLLGMTQGPKPEPPPTNTQDTCVDSSPGLCEYIALPWAHLCSYSFVSSCHSTLSIFKHISRPWHLYEEWGIEEQDAVRNIPWIFNTTSKPCDLRCCSPLLPAQSTNSGAPVDPHSTRRKIIRDGGRAPHHMHALAQFWGDPCQANHQSSLFSRSHAHSVEFFAKHPDVVSTFQSHWHHPVISKPRLPPTPLIRWWAFHQHHMATWPHTACSPILLPSCSCSYPFSVRVPQTFPFWDCNRLEIGLSWKAEEQGEGEKATFLPSYCPLMESWAKWLLGEIGQN